MTDIVETLKLAESGWISGSTLQNARVVPVWVIKEAIAEIVRLRELMSMESGYEIKLPPAPKSIDPTGW